MAESEAAERARMLREIEAMRRAIVSVHEAYAWFECSFAWILGVVLGARHSEAASHIYFAPAATDTRLRIVDSVVRLVVEDRWEFGPPDDESAERFLTQWSWIMNRANRLRKTRNEIIHGQIAGVRPKPEARLQARLVPVLADTERGVGSRKKGQYPGLSAGDIEQNARAMSALGDDLLRVQQILKALTEGDAATFLRRLGELEHHRQKATPPKGAPNPPAS